MLGDCSVGGSLFDRQRRIRIVHLVLVADGVIKVRVTLAIQFRERNTLTDPATLISFRLGEMAK